MYVCDTHGKHCTALHDSTITFSLEEYEGRLASPSRLEESTAPFAVFVLPTRRRSATPNKAKQHPNVEEPRNFRVALLYHTLTGIESIRRCELLVLLIH